MDRKAHLAGIGYGLLAYVIWGGFPIYFRRIEAVSPLDILINRITWAFVFLTLLLALSRNWQVVRRTLCTPRQLLRLTAGALLLAGNWLGFLWVLNQHQLVASALGYFLTPLFSVALGLLVLKEKLGVREWLAIGLAVAALGNELLVLGELPWISLFLAGSFGVYGLLRKQVPLDAISGLWLETLALLPCCLLYAAWQASTGHSVLAAGEASTAVMLVGAGILTTLPLMAFAAATQRLDLATVGMLMYINPTLQFLTAVFLFDEPMQPDRLISFGLIWLGLLVFSSGLWAKNRNRG